jgi:hypothetical protein
MKILSRDDETSLELSALDEDFFQATLQSTGINARAPVSALMADGLAELFMSIARDWRGWSDVRAWRSLEGELELRAAFVKNGNVELDVSLHFGAPAVWRVATVITVESGQLPALADAACAFEETLRGAG